MTIIDINKEKGYYTIKERQEREIKILSKQVGYV